MPSTLADMPLAAAAPHHHGGWPPPPDPGAWVPVAVDPRRHAHSPPSPHRARPVIASPHPPWSPLRPLFAASHGRRRPAKVGRGELPPLPSRRRRRRRRPRAGKGERGTPPPDPGGGGRIRAPATSLRAAHDDPCTRLHRVPRPAPDADSASHRRQRAQHGAAAAGGFPDAARAPVVEPHPYACRRAREKRVRGGRERVERIRMRGGEKRIRMRW